MAVNARPISLNMSFISALALNLDINAAIRRQACDQIVAVLLIALHRRPAFTVTLRPYCRRRYALRNQRITHRLSPLLRQPLVGSGIADAIRMARNSNLLQLG